MIEIIKQLIVNFYKFKFNSILEERERAFFFGFKVDLDLDQSEIEKNLKIVSDLIKL